MSQYPHAFNEDTILQNTFAELVQLHKPDLILETGTHRADTTLFFASFGVPVISTEINIDFFNESLRKVGNLTNVRLLLGDSANQLQEHIAVFKDKKVLAFLDSHFLNDQVLERELDILSTFSPKPIIIIHDFYVPGKDFGYDTWDGHRYDLEFYKPYFDKVYGENQYSYRYNTEAVGCRRGVIILEPTVSIVEIVPETPATEIIIPPEITISSEETAAEEPPAPKGKKKKVIPMSKRLD